MDRSFMSEGSGNKASGTPAAIPEFTFALVPSGEFLMGSEHGQDDQRPVHRVWVGSFEMAVFQVRNRDYAIFLQATNHPAPPHWGEPDFSGPDQPVVAVN